MAVKSSKKKYQDKPCSKEKYRTNLEVFTGSYFAKKTTFAMMFLRGWADCEFRLPRNFHGQDNGALHVGAHSKSSKAASRQMDIWGLTWKVNL
ncbi:unnamed protein product [Cylicostephanus goldi]|uniref:Uncharacterized protein n=1 Tax=Cylicostephanus goldi TaxID=71465 RepID=A0A3P7NGF4_CYLGO|nr:unnamed protein product [Cylicostephanus goldi]